MIGAYDGGGLEVFRNVMQLDCPVGTEGSNYATKWYYDNCNNWLFWQL